MNSDADHRAGRRVHQHVGEPARLDLEGGVEGHQRAFVDRRQQRLGGGVDALGLAVDHGGGADEGHEARRVIGRAAGHLVALGVPRFDDVGVLRGQHPFLGLSSSCDRSTTSSIRPAALAVAGSDSLPSSRNGAAAIAPSLRTSRVVPPAPGKMPTMISGRPILALGLSAAKMRWQASGISKPDAQRGAGQGGGDRLAALQGLGVHARRVRSCAGCRGSA